MHLSVTGYKAAEEPKKGVGRNQFNFSHRDHRDHKEKQ